MSLPSVFISYNPQSDLEMTLAVRLHTIGGVNGLQINLPDRLSFHQSSLTEETKHRIRSSNYFMLFSTSLLSSVVLQEIEYAFSVYKDRSKIIVIYNKNVNKLPLAKNCTEIFIDTNRDLSTIVNEITVGIRALHAKTNGTSIGLGALILAGLGLFALANIFDNDTGPKGRKRSYKKPAKKKVPPKKRRPA